MQSSFLSVWWTNCGTETYKSYKKTLILTFSVHSLYYLGPVDMLMPL